jgi:site-specific DNA-cytosine methylase
VLASIAGFSGVITWPCDLLEGNISAIVALLMRRYPELLPRSTIQRYQWALPSDIILLGAQDLARVGPIDLVITGWPCQGHTWAGRGKGLRDP